MRTALFCGLVVFVNVGGCAALAGGSIETSGEGSVSATAEIEGIEQEIDHGVDALVAPVDDAEAVIAELEVLPQKLGLDSTSFSVALVASLQEQAVLNASGAPLAEAAQAELHTFGRRLLDVIARVQAVPEEAKQLMNKVAAALPRIPVLAAEASASAQLTLRNPLASAEAKQKAQADIQILASLPSASLAKLKGAQERVVALPARAIAAIKGLLAIVPSGKVDLLALGREHRVARFTGHTPEAAVTAARAAASASEATPISASAALRLITTRLRNSGAYITQCLDAARRLEEESTAIAKTPGVTAEWYSAALSAAMQSAPDPTPPRHVTITAETTQRVHGLAAELAKTLPSLGALSSDLKTLRDAARTGEQLLPSLMVSANTPSSYVLADPAASVEEREHARRNSASLELMATDALVAIRAVDESSASWLAQGDALYAGLATNLDPAVLSTLMADTTPLLPPFPPVLPAPPPPPIPKPMLTVSSRPRPHAVSKSHTATWLYVASGATTAAALASAIYIADRNAAYRDCVHQDTPSGSCKQEPTIWNQRVGGIVTTVLFSVSAAAFLIAAIVVDSGDENTMCDDTATQHWCGPNGCQIAF